MAVEESDSTTVFEVENPDAGPEIITTKGGEVIDEAGEESSAKGEGLEAKFKGKEKPEAKTETVVESYNPDFSYSVLDQKKEFPEWVRQSIKDKKAEDELRDIFTKAEGLAPVKEKYEGLSQKHSKLESDHNQQVERLGELQFYLDKGHYGHFFEKIGVPQQKVVEFVAGLLREQDMSPEQRAQVHAFRAQDVEGYNTKKSMSALERQNQQLMVNQHQLSMERAIGMPEVRKISDYVDGVQGAGAFRDAINTYGRAYYHQHGRDLPAADAVAAVMKQYEAFLPKDVNSNQNDLISAKAELKSGRPTGHIPNVGKRTGASPVRAAVRSLDDLKRRAKELAG